MTQRVEIAKSSHPIGMAFFLPTRDGFLTLENGAQFKGDAPLWQEGIFSGEVVFTTGMCGYYESLTDPSYEGQILLFTYPLIGNYGVASEEKWESKKIHASGVIVSESCALWNHHQGLWSLSEWLESQKIPLLTGVDTRAVTKILRVSGTMLGAISSELLDHPYSFFSLSHPVERVSRKEIQLFGKGKKRVIVVDCGMKKSMLDHLLRYSIEVMCVPYNYDYANEEFDAVFLSNGPGDPEECIETIRVLKEAMKRKKPIYGVCLGAQLLALASGAKTYKLPFGHRGQNQPCMELATKKCYITSQNHGYAVDENSLSDDWEVTFRNLNDGSVEGIAHKTEPFCAVQFHPEAAPGPTDTQWFFEKFYSCLKK